MSDLDPVRLREVVSANQTSKAVFRGMIDRAENGRSAIKRATDLRQFQYKLVQDHNAKLNRKDYFNFFRDLEKEGVGSLILRKNRPPRFKWNWTLKDVVKSVESYSGNSNEKSISHEELHTEPTKSTEKDNVVPLPERPTKPAPTPAARTFSMLLVLERRNGAKIEVNLPADLTHEEAQELGDIIQSLR